MKHVRTIIKKEWAEVFKHRMVMVAMLVIPLTFTLLPLIMLGVTSGLGAGAGLPAGADLAGQAGSLPPGMEKLCVGMTSMDCLQAVMVTQFLLMFTMMPLMLPITIAAYSIVGEKTTRSLEPLLATPISTIELLAGKSLAAVIPAVGVTWASFAIFNIGVLIMKISPAVRGFILSPTWLLGILLLGPILAVISVNFALYVSSRVSDPRVAEQISGVLIVPLLGVIVAQIVGLISVNVTFMLIAIVLCAVIAVGMLYLGTVIFDRENIITKWK